MNHVVVTANHKLAKQRIAADKVADILIASLRKLPKEEQKARIKAIQKVRIVKTAASIHL